LPRQWDLALGPFYNILCKVSSIKE